MQDLQRVFPPIIELIPHREPMILVDKISEIQDLSCTSTFRISADCIFVDSETHNFSEFGLIENIAQTALSFIKIFLKEKSESQSEQQFLGYISSIQQLENYGKAYLEDELLTHIQVELALNSEKYKICNILGVIEVKEKVIFKMTSKMVMHLV